MAAKSRKGTGGSKSTRDSAARNVTSGTLIASIIAAFLVGYIVSAFTGGFRLDSGISGSNNPASTGSAGSLIQSAPSRSEYIDALEQRASQNPGDQDIWTELGNAYFDNDRYLEAIEAYQRSLQIDPGNADVWTDMGIMQRRSGDFFSAIEAFDRAAAEDPYHQMSRFNKGIVLFYDLEDRVGAFQSWDELARMNPNFRTPNGQSIVQMMRDLR